MACCTTFATYDIHVCNITFTTLSGLMVDVDLSKAVSYQRNDVLYIKGVNGEVAVNMSDPPVDALSNDLTLEIVRDAIDECKVGA